MKAVDPTIKVGAVIVNGEDAYANYSSEAVTNSRTGATHSGWTPVLLTALKNLGVTPDFLIYHKYGNADGDAELMQLASTWPSDVTGLRQQVTDLSRNGWCRGRIGMHGKQRSHHLEQ